ncbi:hypothetical protein ABKV19_004079 [Rosa sericea]
MNRQRLQLLGVAWMMIASKYEEICARQVEEFCYITDNTYFKEEVLEMKSSVLNYLKFEMTAATTKYFLRRFVRAAQGANELPSMQLECLANYLAELSLLDYSMLSYAPSLQLFLMNRMWQGIHHAKEVQMLPHVTTPENPPRRYQNSNDYQVILEDNIDPDSMTYEELLELGEAVGTESRGLSQDMLSLLPISKYKCSFFSRKKSRSERCVICQMEYKRGDRQITLPCKHLYHAGCGTIWLSMNKACPICYTEVFGNGSTSKK